MKLTQFISKQISKWLKLSEEVDNLYLKPLAIYSVFSISIVLILTLSYFNFTNGILLNLTTLFSINLLCIFLYSSYVYGLLSLKKDLINNTSGLIMVSVFFVTILICARLFESLSGYLVPVPMIGILISILLDPLLALLAVVHLSVLVGLLYQLDLAIFFVLLFSSIISIYTVRQATQRTTITKTGLEICLVNIVLITVMGFLKHNPAELILVTCGWGIFNGLGSSVLSLGLLPVLEDIFKIITPMRLIELAYPSQPLLKKLMTEAPGTYQHSLMVANLVEPAVEKLGGNSLLARVGTYYHDVGKLKRPNFFIENQQWIGNPHDKLDPKLSAIIITSHVKDGIGLLKEYRIPKPLNAFVKEHHGTGLVAYFYRQMIIQKNIDFDEEQFRYQQPKPQSIETAVLMLADAVEAASRTIERNAPNKLKGIIDKIVKEKLDDGQLDEAPVTLADLTLIKQVFLDIITSSHHQRIEYPETEKTESSE